MGEEKKGSKEVLIAEMRLRPLDLKTSGGLEVEDVLRIGQCSRRVVWSSDRGKDAHALPAPVA